MASKQAGVAIMDATDWKVIPAGEYSVKVAEGVTEA